MSSNVFAANVYYSGNVIVSQTLNVATLNVTTMGAITSTAAATFSATPAAAANVLTVVGSSTTGNVVQFSNSAGGNFIMTSAGNVGIGTTAPSQKLHVNSGNVYVQATTASVLVNRLYVAVAYGSGTAASSTDGITWTARTLPTNTYWRGVTVNPTTGVFVAVSDGSSIAASSTDGITWTQRTLPFSTSWSGVTCNPTTGLFVAVSENSGYSAASTDGITWTGGNIFGGNTYNWQAVTVNPTTGLFVAVCFDTSTGGPTTVAASSVDGINWNQRSMPATQEWRAVTCNPTTGLFVAVGQLNFGNTTAAASSTNGISWDQRTIPSGIWRGVTVNPTTGVFVAVGTSGAYAASSTDGITWTTRNSGVYTARGVTCNPNTGGFVAVAYSSGTAASSTDGITWTARTLPADSNWNAVTTGSATVISTTAGFIGIGVAVPSYQLDLSTDGARKLTTTTWLTGSDQRIKTDVESANLQTCYDTVKSVDLKYFKWNFPEGIVPDDRHSLGFIAQEVKEVFPNAVSESNSYGYEDFLSLNVDQINKALFGAVKYLAAKVEALEAAVTVSEPAPEVPEPVPGEVPQDL